MFTISAVVLLHLGVIAVLVGVNGCRTTTGFEKPGDLSAYNGTTVNPGATASLEPPSFNEVPVAQPVPTPAPRGSKMGSGTTHTIARGDTLWSVSRRAGVSVQQLANANGLQVNAVLREGQKLTIPSANAPSGAPAAAPRAAAPSTPAPRPNLSLDAGGFGGFGNADPAAAPVAPAAPAAPADAAAPASPGSTQPTPAAPTPAAPAPTSNPSTLTTGEGGFGGFGTR